MPLVIGGLVMAICFIVTGSLYARYGHTTADSVILTSTAAQWVVIVLIYVFVPTFPGHGPWYVLSMPWTEQRTGIIGMEDKLTNNAV
jgi:uncharacterized PurR-regulated membrane protein YhhQ (DUF165 family)